MGSPIGLEKEVLLRRVGHDGSRLSGWLVQSTGGTCTDARVCSCPGTVMIGVITGKPSRRDRDTSSHMRALLSIDSIIASTISSITACRNVISALDPLLDER